MLTVVGVAVWLSVLTVSWWCAPRLVPHQDECWFLLVVRRVAEGRRLYRGVFFGAGPWSVWAARPVVRLLGERLVVLRRTAVVLSVVLGGAAWAWTSAVGVPWPVGLAVAAGSTLLSTALWSADNQYGLWSRIGVMVALAAPIALDDVSAVGVVGGLGLALALLNKYSLGVAAVPGVLATAAATGAWGGGLAVVGSGFALAVAGYAVEARGGVGPSMVRRVFSNKRTFVSTAGAGFLAGWRSTAGRPAARLVTEWRVSWVAFGLTTLSGGVVLLGGAVAVARGGDLTTMWATLAVTLVALASLWPRADDVHVRSSLALWTVPAVAAAHHLDPAVGVGWAVLVAGAGLVAAGLAVTEQRRFRPASPAGTPFDGTDPWPWDLDSVLAGGHELDRLTGGTVFLLRPDAAVWYLATGLRNPTPYDYPLASPFGPDGQQQLAANLASGRVRYCCWSPSNAGALTPVHLEEYAASLPVVARTVAGALVTAG